MYSNEEWIPKMANQTIETLADIQSMIDIMSERLVALRDLRLQEFIKEEIRSLEGKLLMQFWEQLKAKSLDLDTKNHSLYKSYPSLSKWLVVVGVSESSKKKIIAELPSLEYLLSLSDNEISKFLDGLPNDKEDVRKVCTALSLLRSLGKNKKSTDSIFWDSWRKGHDENGLELSRNASGIDHNENVRTSAKADARDDQSSISSHISHPLNVSRYNTTENLHSRSHSSSGSTAINASSSPLDGPKTLPHSTTSSDVFASTRQFKSHSRQSSGQLLQKPKVSTGSSSISPSPLNSSVEKIAPTANRRIKKRPGSIELPPSALPDFVDIMRPSSACATRKTSQTASSHDSSGESPMSPRTPLTPVIPQMFSQYHYPTDQHSSHHSKHSRFKGLRAIKDKIKDKMGISSSKLKRNKSEERLEEVGNEKVVYKNRSDTCPDANSLIIGLDQYDTTPHLSSALIANKISRINTESLPDGHFESLLFKSYQGSVEDLTGDPPDIATTSISSEDGADLTHDESEETEEARYRGRLMRQSSAMSNVNEEWDVPWDELVFQEQIGKGRVGTVYKGRWHGEVAIRVINVFHNDESQLRAFKEEVTLYKKTRHDNIELFMGSSMNPPKLAIITSYCHGKSLYQYIRSNTINLNGAKLIAQHIVQGMGYLHSRGIVHKDLKSKNVFISKSRVTITDFGILGLHAISSKSIPIRRGVLQIPDGWLCYMAPEIIRALRVPNYDSNVQPSLPYTKESDMYAFGTVWYEMLTGTWPFQDCCAESIIWQVGNGRKQSLAHFHGSKEFKDILMGCWARDPAQRQDFSDSGVMGQLLRLPQAKITRRSSQPIKSNKKGFKHGGLGTNDRMFDLSLQSVIHELAE